MQKHNPLKFQWEKIGEVVWLAWWDGSRYGPGYDSRSLKVSQSQKGRDMTWRVEAKPNPARRRKKMFVQSLECHWNDGMMALKAADWWPPFPVIQWVPGLTDFFGFIWASKKMAGAMNRHQSHHGLTLVLPLCHSAMAKDHSFLSGGKVAKRCRAIPCYSLCCSSWTVILMWEVEPSTVGFLDQRVTARFARNRKHPSIDDVEVSSEKQGSFSNDLTGKRAKPQHQSPFHLPPRNRDKCGILL